MGEVAGVAVALSPAAELDVVGLDVGSGGAADRIKAQDAVETIVKMMSATAPSCISWCGPVIRFFICSVPFLSAFVSVGFVLHLIPDMLVLKMAWVGTGGGGFAGREYSGAGLRRTLGTVSERGIDHQGAIMLAGAAEIDITPPAGIDLTGYVARLGPSVGLHDRLCARALVIDDGTTRAAIIVCDLVGLDSAYVERARREIGAAIGAAPGAVMVACTHTHSGPATIFLHQCGEVDPAYLEGLRPKLVEVARRAAGGMRPVRVGAAEGDLPGSSFDRRGTGKAVDTSVPVAVLQDARGAAVATVTGYACHPVTMMADNLLISADYPGAVTRAIAEAFGGIALFVTGADGNVDPIARGSFEDVQRLGQALAGEAVRVARGATLTGPDRLVVVRERVDLPLMPLPAAGDLVAMSDVVHTQLRRAEAAGEPVAIRVARAMVGWAASVRRRLADGSMARMITAEIQVIALGPVVWVGIPGELFSGLGAQIRAAGGGRTVFVVGYANGDVGYIPDREAYAEGGYEVTDAYKYYDAPAALAPEAGELVVATARRLLGETVG